MSLAYIRGVLDGDGYIDKGNINPRLALDTKSEEFAERFFIALKKIGLSPYMNERNRTRRNFNGYTFDAHHFIVRATSPPQLVDKIKNLPIRSKKEKKEYLRGIFDSEGSYSVTRYADRTCYYLKNTNADIDLLRKIQRILTDFGIQTKVRISSSRTPYLDCSRKKNIKKIFDLMEVNG